MDRRAFITASILAVPLAAEGQRVGKVYRVGYLTVPSRETALSVANSFQLGLRDLGWIEGQNVVVDYRFADSNLDRLPDLARWGCSRRSWESEILESSTTSLAR